VWSATTYYQFTGTCHGWSPSWPTNKQDVLTVTATDAFKVLTQTRYANDPDTPEPMETIATRVGKILTVAVRRLVAIRSPRRESRPSRSTLTR
jgi:hypothetical protein